MMHIKTKIKFNVLPIRLTQIVQGKLLKASQNVVKRDCQIVYAKSMQSNLTVFIKPVTRLHFLPDNL